MLDGFMIDHVDQDLQRPGDGRHSKASTKETLEERSLVQRHGVDHDSDGAGEDTGTAESGNRTANNEDCRARSCTTNCATNLKEEDARKERPLRGIEGVDASIEENESTCC